MTTIREYIKEAVSHGGNSNYEEKLSDGIDLTKYSWPRHGISDGTLNACKENVRDYAYQHYFKEMGVKDYMEEILKDTYIEYGMNACNWSAEKSENELSRYLRILKFQGFEYIMEQGWWHFVNWMIEQKR